MALIIYLSSSNGWLEHLNHHLRFPLLGAAIIGIKIVSEIAIWVVQSTLGIIWHAIQQLFVEQFSSIDIFTFYPNLEYNQLNGSSMSHFPHERL